MITLDGGILLKLSTNMTTVLMLFIKSKRSIALVHSADTFSPAENQYVQSVSYIVYHNIRSTKAFKAFHDMSIISTFTHGDIFKNQCQY